MTETTAPQQEYMLTLTLPDEDMATLMSAVMTCMAWAPEHSRSDMLASIMPAFTKASAQLPGFTITPTYPDEPVRERRRWFGR